MPRYIDADKIPYDPSVFGDFDDSVHRYDIDGMPTADVVEVKHGEWNDNVIGFCNVCMECGAIVERSAIKNKSGQLNYCPNCGAKMDGEKALKEREKE